MVDNTNLPYDFDAITDNDEIVSIAFGGEPWKCLKVGDALMNLKWIGLFPDYRKHIPNIKSMEMDFDDVIVCSAPKAGTHWVWEITNMLMAGKAEYHPKPKLTGMMEFTPVDKLRAIPRPRVLNTHFTFSCLPEDAIEKNCKLIHVQRNPKDVLVSYQAFLKGFEELDQDVSWDEYFDKYLEMDVESSLFNWFYYTRSWYEVLKEKPDNIHTLTYEDLKEDPIREITKLAKFLCVTENECLFEDIAEKCSFQKLKEASKSKTEDPHLDKTDIVYRKGQVGDWKNHFTVAQNEKFDAVYRKRMKDVNIQYRYTL